MRIILIICFTFFLVSCSKEKAHIVSISFPFYKSCQDEIERARALFNDLTSRKDYKLSVSIEKFDEVPKLETELVGIVRFISEGDWKTLDGGTPLDYLKLEAKGVQYSCTPNNSIIVPINDIALEYFRVKSEKKGVALKILNQKDAIIYFNDGTLPYNY
ncbi:hypothetical protein [Marinomonas balearica]|uniref:Lipoprotein n=1 Tax=Marinomonas balearica TaxID=491947 RepID=A0A4R6MI32_9GAMM|nr:hypothetical protein [Marinomonas balearica]TDP01237.1 hypothetical protein DFP79_0139 [Marinomonas balearica]